MIISALSHITDILDHKRLNILFISATDSSKSQINIRLNENAVFYLCGVNCSSARRILPVVESMSLYT